MCYPKCNFKPVDCYPRCLIQGTNALQFVHLRGAPVAGLLTEDPVERHGGVGRARRGERQREEVRHGRPTLVLQRARRLRGLRLLREVILGPGGKEEY